MAAQFYKLTNITKFAYNGQILWYAHFIQNFLYKKIWEMCVCVYEILKLPTSFPTNTKENLNK